MGGDELVLNVNNVSKSFNKGELHDSLRDLIPAVAARLMRREHVSKTRKFWALQDVSFSLVRGEAFGIIGSNGAGKSTILKLISGVMKPTRGTIDVKGRLSALIEVGAGFHPDLTGRENIYLNGTILGMSRAEISRKFSDIVDFSGLEEFIDTPVKRYSTGMYARLGFSVAAHVEPDILIVDEVLSVGDIVFQNRCLERMNAIIRSGASVIFVSHNLRAIAELCPRSILLEYGKVVETAPSQHVIRTYLERAAQRQSTSEKPLFVSAVTVVDRKDRATFASGDRISVTIDVDCKQDSEPFSVVLFAEDDRSYEVFHTSTEYLDVPATALKQGQRLTCCFELSLHLATGTYYLGVVLYRFSTQKVIERFFPAATIFMSSTPTVRGLSNPYPELARFSVSEISASSERQPLDNRKVV